MTAPPAVVRVLTGARGFDTTLACLPTLVRLSSDPVRLAVHEDGTLTGEHRDRLSAAVPGGVEFVGRAEGDAFAADRLRKHPAAAAARAASVLYLKVFDIPLWGGAERFAYCDSDVLFLRPYSGLFPGDGPPTFMADSADCYAVRPWEVWPAGPLRLGRRVNTGLITAPASAVDLDFLDWLLARFNASPTAAARKHWAEQTAWAAVAGRTAARLADPARVAVATPRMSRVGPDTVAVHFVSTYRDRLADYVNRPAPADPTPVRVGTVPAGRTSPLRVAAADLRRRAGWLG